MKTFKTNLRVAHSAEQMFALVADVESYPQFVPLCESLRVRKRSDAGEGREIIVADMTVAYKLIRERYTSRITLDRPNLSIDVENIDGPFERLENRWRFTPDGEAACTVGFSLVYGFRSRMFETVAGAVFDRAFGKFSGAFVARADEVYGAA